MTFHIGLNVVGELELEEATGSAAQDGYRVYELPRTGIVDRESLFDAVRARLPLDPPLVGSRSWDALSDSLWGGIDSLDAKRVAVIWPNSRELKASSPRAYKMAIDVFADVAASLADATATIGSPKEVVILVGAGPRP